MGYLMSKSLSLFYWNGHPNAGDYFGHYFCNKHGIDVSWTNNQPEYAIVGSILNSARLDNAHIWGCGFHSAAENRPRKKHLIHAVRGKLSAKILGLPNITLGDTGILASTVFNGNDITKTHRFGIISHYVDTQYFKKNAPLNFKIIDMGTNDVETVLRDINCCEFVFSSSLHGIIFAHSFGIPAMHIIHNPLHDPHQFKFHDYYSPFHLEYVPKPISEVPFFSTKELGFLYDAKNLFHPSHDEIVTMQQQLLDACPFKELL